MENKNIMNFIDANGNEKIAEVLVAFEAGEPLKKYVIYTMNEESNGMVTMYAATLSEDENGISLNNIDDEDEWKMVKDVMRDIVKENEGV